MKITNRVVENYLNCRYKAFLALKGEIGTPHDYEVLMNELAEEYRPKATEALLRRCMLTRHQESLLSPSMICNRDMR